MRRHMLVSPQYGTATWNTENYFVGASMNASMQEFPSSATAVAKMTEPVTPLSFLKNADKKLLLTGVLA